MRDLILENKTGFRSTLPFKIFDTRGILFYSSEFTNKIEKGIPLKFNVPAGVWKYEGNFVKLDSPVPVKNLALPLKERNFAKKRYDIQFADNPNKCSIYYDRGVIIFDNSFKNKPLYVKYMIYFHELGHHFYKTEDKADLYSAKILLEQGFNPSQIQLAVLDSLSDKSLDRKMKIVYMLTNNEG